MAYPRFEKWRDESWRARGTRLRGGEVWGGVSLLIGEGCPLPTEGEVWGGGYAPPQKFVFDFWAQNDKFLVHYGSIELHVLHALAGRLWLVKPAIASLCVKKVQGGVCLTVPSAWNLGGDVPCPPVDTPLGKCRQWWRILSTVNLGRVSRA